MLRSPAGPLADPLGETAQRTLQAGQIPAASTALPCVLRPDGRPRHVSGQAVPAALPAQRLAERGRHDPAGVGQMPEHRVLVGQILPGGLGVIAAQHEALRVGGLDQPVRVPEWHVLEQDDTACFQAE